MFINLFALSGLLITITCVLLIIILIKFGKTRVHRLGALFNLSVCVWGFGGFLLGISPTENVARITGRIAHLGVIFIPIFFYHTIIVFCRLNRKKVILFSYIQGVIFSLIFIFLINVKFLTIIYIFDSFYYPVFTNDLPGFIFGIIFFLIWMFFVLLGHYELLKLYRKATFEKRNQIIYFFVGLATGFSGGVMNFLPAFHIFIYPYGNFLIPFYCIIVTYAILKHQLMDIKVAIQKSFIYSILVAFITATYFILVFLAEKLFQGMVGYTSLIVSIFYAFVITLFFNPVKNRIQLFADRFFLGRDPVQIAKENELLRQEILRSEKLKTIATFASGMAHEIKNPLTAIKTFTEFLPQKTDDKEFLARFSKIVGPEVEKIDNLVHQLLDFSKPAPLQLKETDIHKLIDDTLELLSNQFIKYNIKVNKYFNANSRESNANIRESEISDHSRSISDHSRLMIKIDEQQIKQVFLNLFLNSIEAMPSGGTLTVSTNLCLSEYKSVLICVEDNGCGISEKDLTHIFEPFYTTKEKGSGLGLSIVYNIIKEHKGKIKAESKLDRGTKFIIELLLS